MFSTWAAMAVGAIGELPGTLEDRSIIVPMQRKAPGEALTSFRQSGRDATAVRGSLELLRRKIKRWVADRAVDLRDAEPTMPVGLHDRAADNWRPLLAVADVIGEPWSAKARQAAAINGLQ